MSLSMLACNGNTPTPQKKITNFSKSYTGKLYTYYRDYTPGSHSDIEESYDTFSLSIMVERRGDTIHFFPSDTMLMPDYTFKITDTTGIGPCFWLNNYRPMESYCLNGDTLNYFYSVADPSGGPYLSTKNFSGISEH